MCCTKLRVEVEQWEDEGVFLVFLLSVKSVPADEVVQEEREEEETCMDRMGVVNTIRNTFTCVINALCHPTLSSNVEFCHQVDVYDGVEGGQENVKN